MYKIIKKVEFNKSIKLAEIEAPLIAKKALPGQFVIVRINETGERIPLTISDHDDTKGTITLIYQQVGKTTNMLGELEEGDCILDVVGPLGKPTDLDGVERACIVVGGLGCAIGFPQAKYLYNKNAHVDIIAGFKTKELIILEEEMRSVSDNLYICTDDGSCGFKGFTTDKLKSLIESGNKYDAVIAIGPAIMMKLVSKLTRKYDIKTIVSLNPIMVDGTGMCGCCRVTVDGKTRFACVDGPDFNGHCVDFDELMKRLDTYKEKERQANEAYMSKINREVSKHG